MRFSVIIACLALFAFAYLYLTAPGRLPREKRGAIARMKFACRGRFNLRMGIPENSRPAFEAAASAGTPILMEVRLTSDNKPVIVSDSVLLRVCDVQRRLEHLPLFMVAQQRAFHTQERILSLEEALACVNGRVPVLLQLISYPDKEERLCGAVRESLAGYRGACMVASYQPRIVQDFRRHMKQIPRGQFLNSYAHMRRYSGRFAAFALSRALGNFIGRPQFFLCTEDARTNASAWLCRALTGTPMVYVASPESLDDDAGAARLNARRLRGSLGPE